MWRSSSPTVGEALKPPAKPYQQIYVAQNRYTVLLRKLWRGLLAIYPGLLIFPVLFSLEVSTIFFLPGVDFALVAWGLAAIVAVAFVALGFGLEFLLPERELRLELLFLLNILIAILGVIATVNGRTACGRCGAVSDVLVPLGSRGASLFSLRSSAFSGVAVRLPSAKH